MPGPSTTPLSPTHPAAVAKALNLLHTELVGEQNGCPRLCRKGEPRVSELRCQWRPQDATAPSCFCFPGDAQAVQRRPSIQCSETIPERASAFLPIQGDLHFLLPQHQNSSTLGWALPVLAKMAGRSTDSHPSLLGLEVLPDLPHKEACVICDQDTHYTTPKHPEKGAIYTNSLLSRSYYPWSPSKPPTDFSPIQFKTAARHRCTEVGSCVPTIQGRGCPGPSIQLSPPPSIASISLRCDCSAGSTKVRTVPGLLARAVLQRPNLSLRICLP